MKKMSAQAKIGKRPSTCMEWALKHIKIPSLKTGNSMAYFLDNTFVNVFLDNTFVNVVKAFLDFSL